MAEAKTSKKNGKALVRQVSSALVSTNACPFPLTPPAFENLCGKFTNAKWKQSLKLVSNPTVSVGRLMDERQWEGPTSHQAAVARDRLARDVYTITEADAVERASRAARDYMQPAGTQSKEGPGGADVPVPQLLPCAGCYLAVRTCELGVGTGGLLGVLAGGVGGRAGGAASAAQPAMFVVVQLLEHRPQGAANWSSALSTVVTLDKQSIHTLDLTSAPGPLADPNRVQLLPLTPMAVPGCPYYVLTPPYEHRFTPGGSTAGAINGSLAANHAGGIAGMSTRNTMAHAAAVVTCTDASARGGLPHALTLPLGLGPVPECGEEGAHEEGDGEEEGQAACGDVLSPLGVMHASTRRGRGQRAGRALPARAPQVKLEPLQLPAQLPLQPQLNGMHGGEMFGGLAGMYGGAHGAGGQMDLGAGVVGYGDGTCGGGTPGASKLKRLASIAAELCTSTCGGPDYSTGTAAAGPVAAGAQRMDEQADRRAGGPVCKRRAVASVGEAGVGEVGSTMPGGDAGNNSGQPAGSSTSGASQPHCAGGPGAGGAVTGPLASTNHHHNQQQHRHLSGADLLPSLMLGGSAELLSVLQQLLPQQHGSGRLPQAGPQLDHNQLRAGSRLPHHHGAGGSHDQLLSALLQNVVGAGAAHHSQVIAPHARRVPPAGADGDWVGVAMGASLTAAGGDHRRAVLGTTACGAVAAQQAPLPDVDMGDVGALDGSRTGSPCIATALAGVDLGGGAAGTDLGGVAAAWPGALLAATQLPLLQQAAAQQVCVEQLARLLVERQARITELEAALAERDRRLTEASALSTAAALQPAQRSLPRPVPTRHGKPCDGSDGHARASGDGSVDEGSAAGRGNGGTAAREEEVMLGGRTPSPPQPGILATAASSQELEEEDVAGLHTSGDAGGHAGAAGLPDADLAGAVGVADDADMEEEVALEGSGTDRPLHLPAATGGAAAAAAATALGSRCALLESDLSDLQQELGSQRQLAAQLAALNAQLYERSERLKLERDRAVGALAAVAAPLRV